MMNERERLIEILKDNQGDSTYYMTNSAAEKIAGILLENGVVVLLRDGNDFNPDLYCPYCGNNLSNTRVFDKALKGDNENE